MCEADGVVSWREVFLGFKREAGGLDPLFNDASAWLNLSAWYAERGDDAAAERCFEAGAIREAYDRDIYDPPADLRLRYGVRLPAPADRWGA